MGETGFLPEAGLPSALLRVAASLRANREIRVRQRFQAHHHPRAGGASCTPPQDPWSVQPQWGQPGPRLPGEGRLCPPSVITAHSQLNCSFSRLPLAAS